MNRSIVWILPLLLLLPLPGCSSGEREPAGESGSLSALRAEEGAAEETARRHMEEGLARFREADFRGAIDAWEKALAVVERLNMPRRTSITLSNLGLAHQRLGEASRALAYFDRALELDRRRSDRKGERDNLRRAGTALYSLGDFLEAEERFEAALAIDVELEDEEGRMTDLTHLANDWWQLGRYAQARRCYEDLRDRARRAREPKRQADALVGIALIEEELGTVERAMEYHEEALGMYRSLGLRSGEAVELNNLGIAARTLKRPEEALERFQGALDLYRDLGDRKGEALVTSNLGEILAIQGRNEDALAEVYAALRIHERIGDKQGQALDQVRLGRIYTAMGNEILAARSLQAAQDLAERIGRPETLWRAHYWLGNLREKEGRYEQALDEYRNAIAVLDDMVSLIGDRGTRLGFLGRKVEPYDACIKLLFRLHDQHPERGYDAEAYACMGKLQARRQTEFLNDDRTTFQDPERQAFIEEQWRLRARIKGIEERLARERERSDGNPDPELIKKLEGLRQEGRAEFHAFVEDLKQEDPRFLSWMSVDPARLGRVQGLLGPREAILEYYVTERVTYFFLVKAEGLFAQKVGVEARLLADEIATVRGLLGRASVFDPGRMARLRKLSRHLYQRLIGPVEGLLEEIDTLGIVPTRVLHYLPFQILVHDGPDGSDRYLLEDYAVYYLNSKTALEISRGEIPRPPVSALQFVGFANADGSLPRAEEEVKGIGKQFRTASLYVGEAATEQRLKLLSSSGGLLHLATHGHLDSLHPRMSYLQMHATEDDDGRLTVHEITGLDLTHTSLVTLSACETAVGNLWAGNGMVSMSDAFLIAGAPAVVASLWCVEDRSTALLMKRYYAHLRAGRNKTEALRRAQLDLMRTRGWDEQEDLPVDYSHPHYWGPFILIGEYR